ncbi:hypothetical protein BpHYR1_037649 [Brachionus plicatilis]|uniref:Uncharacterized protein n=1 Tax=Brachionus plicatilis TaxID=10195 RepID=A0A3M7RKB3_BRAPC|nr:hypothetical protein BpHYR1_037649 [Brachionus plicatilis]
MRLIPVISYISRLRQDLFRNNRMRKKFKKVGFAIFLFSFFLRFSFFYYYEIYKMSQLHPKCQKKQEIWLYDLVILMAINVEAIGQNLNAILLCGKLNLIETFK